MSVVKEALLAAWREPPTGGDVGFADAVRAALPAFNGAEMREAADKGVTSDLIGWLLSDRPLGVEPQQVVLG